MGPVAIDGSWGEGGGQVVRTAVTLSCVTGRPVRVSNVRAGRGRPGLRPQHLAGVRMLAGLCGARTRGLAAGSTELEFEPGGPAGGEAAGDVGTAGSVPLVLSVLVPAAALGGRGAELSVRGGTDVPWSPTCDYFSRVLGEAYSRMGIRFRLEVGRRGYYPRGGGLVRASVRPCGELRPAALAGVAPRRASLRCTYSRAGGDAARGAAGAVAARLEEGGLEVESRVSREDADGPGAALLVHRSGPGSVAGADALYGEGGFGGAAGRLLAAAGGADEHLADMLVVPASVAGGTSAVRVGRVTRHLETNLRVAAAVTGCRYGIGRAGGLTELRIEGRSDARV